MTDPSLLFLKMIPIEQKGWLTLRTAEGQPMTAQSVVGHIGADHLVVLSFWQQPVPTSKLTQAEFRYIDKSGIYTLTGKRLEAVERAGGGMRLTMSAPFEMTHRQQRDFIRIEPETTVTVSFTPLFPDDYRAGTGVVKDMSGNGLRFVTDEFVHKESILRLSFPLPERERVITVIGQVVRKEFVKDETVTSVRYLEVEPDDQKAIVAYCVAEQLRLAQRQVRQRRKFARVTPAEPFVATLRGIDSTQVRESEVVNLGGGGLLVKTPFPLPSCPIYQTVFAIPPIGQTIEAYVKVLESRKEHGAFFYHLEFVDISGEHQEAIIEYVLEQQLALLNEPDANVTPPSA